MSTENLTQNQTSALDELKANYKRTKFNYYASVRLALKTGITLSELNDLYVKKLITVSQGVNDKIIKLVL